MHVVVLGAGLIGVAGAWYLREAGHEVTVLDRQPAPALETSFANGGQISVSHAEPWANPAAPRAILRWLGQEEAPLLYRPRLSPRQWAWGLRFLMECLPQRTRANTARILDLALRSQAELGRLRAEMGLAYDQRSRGILHVYSDAASFRHGCDGVAAYRARGLEMQIVDRVGCLQIEPALAEARAPIAGGIYAPSDESGDAHLFTRALAARAAQAGVTFSFETAVEFIDVSGGRVRSIATRNRDGSDGRVRADAYVVSLGSYSAPLLRPAGLRLPVYPVKGYSITVPLAPGDRAPQVSLTDEAHKIVFSRLGERLRVAGTAELAGFDTELNLRRCEAIVARTRALFPGLARLGDVQFWTGLRPATPSNLPCIGRTRIPNLYLNTGHGTLGWTLACGSGAVLAQVLAEAAGGAPATRIGF